jgi:hypothetical protein
MELNAEQVRQIKSLKHHEGFKALAEYVDSVSLFGYYRALNKTIVSDLDCANHNAACGTIAGARMVFGVPDHIEDSYSTFLAEKRLEEEEARAEAATKEQDNGINT